VNFDIERYKQLVARLDDSDVEYEHFRTQRLPEPALRCLRYMHDVEHHTACYLRDLLVTRAHRDPELTTFLTCWAFEELWHGEAIGRVLAAHGESSGTLRVAAARRRARWSDRMAPFTMALSSATTEHITAVHMTWGAINEWTTQAGYGQLVQKCDDPVLTTLLRSIMKQEGRHIDFYASQAAARLDGSSTAQRMTRFVLKRRWAPVGSGVMPDAEVRHLVTYLFGDVGGREAAARIDRRIERLPGLDGLALVDTARRRLAAPQPVSVG
jgi:hypothetical protein